MINKTAKPGTSSHSLSLSGGMDKHEELLEAYMLQASTNEEGETETIETVTGLLQTISYNELVEKVVVVPVNGADVSKLGNLQTALNKIYAQAVTRWEVTMHTGVEYDFGDEFDNGVTGMLSNYTAHMRRVKRRFGRDNSIDNKTYYIFVVPGNTKESGKQAFMPRKKQSGFLFAKNMQNLSAADWVTILAHELGHGAFRLEHHANASGNTDNLMDYARGNFLHKHQWDLIHDPESMSALFQDDAEGAYSYTDLIAIDVSNHNLNAIGFMTPSGVGVKLPSTVNRVRFHKLNGSLYSFDNNGTTYSYIGVNSVGFYGYVPKDVISDLQLTAGTVFTESIANTIESLRQPITELNNGAVILSAVQQYYSFEHLADCYCIYKWNYESVGNEIYSNSKFGTIPIHAEKLNCSGAECGQLNENALPEPGASLYLYVTRKKQSEEKTLTASEDSKLRDLSLWLNEEIESSDFVFYYDDSENFYQSGKNISNQTLKYIYENSLLDIDKFNIHFKRGQSRDIPVIFSTVDLWDNLPENYNQYSIDFVKGGVYHYSFGDLKSRKEYLQGQSVIRTAIIQAEESGMATPISSKDGYDQYVAEYGSDAGFILIAKSTAEWSRDVLAAYMVHRMIAQSGVLIVKEMGSGFSQSAVIDYGIQATFNYLFDDRFESFSEAASPENINWISVGVSGMEGTVKYQNLYLELGISGMIGCFVNGLTDESGFKESFDINGCAFGVAGAFLGKGISLGIGKIGKHLRPLSKYTDDQLRKGLSKLGINGKDADDVINFIRNNTSGSTSGSTAGSWLDDIFDKQKTVFNQNKNSIANATNNAKGVFGEIASDVHLTEKGFQPLHMRKTSLSEGWGEQGIDGVFKKDGQYFIVEAKYSGTSRLKTLADGTKQMSDDWILGNDRLLNAVGQDMYNQIRAVGYKRVLSEVAPDGSIIFKELDSSANIIGTLPL